MKGVVFVALMACSWATFVASEDATKPLALSEMIENAKKSISDLAATVQKDFNFPDQETVINTLKNQSNVFVNTVQGYINNVSEGIKNNTPELEKVLTDVKEKLSKAVEDINVPNAKESAEQLQKKIQEGVDVLVKESNKVVEAFKENSGNVKEEAAGIAKKTIDLTVEAIQNINDQLKNAANQAATAA